MKLLWMFFAPIVAVGLASTVSARDYHDLVAEGYRWVKIDGPCACCNGGTNTNQLAALEAFKIIRSPFIRTIYRAV